jgi:hypothetical protein
VNNTLYYSIHLLSIVPYWIYSNYSFVIRITRRFVNSALVVYRKKMSSQLIITHAGSAHFDEVTAISLVLASFDSEFSIERREPSPDELENPSIWVIDTGNRYEPEKRNFDHHQALDCPAGFILVADYLKLLDSLSVLPWWKFKDDVDRFGPARASQKHNAGDDLINRNPVESWLVDKFSLDPQGCASLLKSFGTSIIDTARVLKKQVDFWGASRRLTINGISAVIGETRESFGLEEFHRQDKNPPDIAISLDRRSDGWRLYRFDGAPVDFSLISNYPQIEFAHKSGFMAKTKNRISIDQLTKLISKAIIAKPKNGEET